MKQHYYTIKTGFGTFDDITIYVNKYRYNNSLAIELISDSEGPFATITVCIDHDRPLESDEAFIDINNCPWAINFIEENNLGKPTGEVSFSGYCEYPLYKFDLDMLKR